MKAPQANDVVAFCQHEDSIPMILFKSDSGSMQISEGDSAGVQNRFNWILACPQCASNFEEHGKIRLVNFKLWSDPR